MDIQEGTRYGRISNLVIFLRDEEIVKCFVDRLVVVILYRSQVRLNEPQLCHLRGEETNNSIPFLRAVRFCRYVEVLKLSFANGEGKYEH